MILSFWDIACVLVFHIPSGDGAGWWTSNQMHRYHVRGSHGISMVSVVCALLHIIFARIGLNYEYVILVIKVAATLLLFTMGPVFQKSNNGAVIKCRNIMLITHVNACSVNALLCPTRMRSDYFQHRWIPLTKASDPELWYFLYSAPEQMVKQTIEMPVIWETIGAHYNVTVMKCVVSRDIRRRYIIGLFSSFFANWKYRWLCHLWVVLFAVYISGFIFVNSNISISIYAFYSWQKISNITDYCKDHHGLDI